MIEGITDLFSEQERLNKKKRNLQRVRRQRFSCVVIDGQITDQRDF